MCADLLRNDSKHYRVVELMGIALECMPQSEHTPSYDPDIDFSFSKNFQFNPGLYS